jgi:uncharacterized protein DUF4395
MRKLFAFPNPVNEVSARLVAAGVLAQSVVFVATGWRWLLVPLTYGFVARVLTGPTLSPLGQVVTRVITPRLGLPARLVPGPPKRFAQGIGAAFTVSAAVAVFGFDAGTLARVLVATVAVAALLESAFAYCVGCKVFAGLMRAGVIPESVCAECNDLGLRVAA